MKIINSLVERANKIVIFTTCELWSNKSGFITTTTEFDFNITNQYTISKLLTINEIKRLRMIDSSYNKVKFIHPFYFNSVYRNKYFLFGKIFDSIVNKKQIEVGNLNFYRDMIHTKFLVQKVISSDTDMVIGSGRLFNVRDFIIDLYDAFGLNFFELVTENNLGKTNEKLIKAKVDWNYTYSDLVSDTILDIKKFISK
jgi:GDP-D-mannose dehydratase